MSEAEAIVDDALTANIDYYSNLGWHFEIIRSLVRLSEDELKKLNVDDKQLRNQIIDELHERAAAAEEADSCWDNLEMLVNYYYLDASAIVSRCKKK